MDSHKSWSLILARKVFPFLLGLILFSFTANAQSTLYMENFTGYANGTTSSSKFTSTCTGTCQRDATQKRFDVNNGAWEIRDNYNGGEGVWSSSVIDISSNSNVGISIAAIADDPDGRMAPGKESEYEIRFYYRLNGGAETPFATNPVLNLNFGSVNATHTGLNGTSVQIVVRAKSEHNQAAYFLDDIYVYGDVDNSTVVPPSCYGGNNGRITTSITAGLLPWVYTWSNGASGNAINNLTAGTYTVTVTGLLGLGSATETYTLSNPPQMFVNNTKVDILCNGISTGSIDVTVSGGAPPYTYTWNTGATTQDLSGLAAGTYTVSVRDGNTCVLTTTATITQPTALNVTNTKTDVTCNGLTNGSIDITVSGATSPYTYLWNTGATTQDLSSLSGGTYTVTVTDANNCTATRTVLINTPALLTASVTTINVNCFGGSNGHIDLTPGGGTTPYTYLWSTGATNQDRNGIVAGTYSVTVTDANGCTVSVTGIAITQPSAALSRTLTKVDVLCNGANTGSIDLTVLGGTTPYSYLWSNGASSQDLTSTIAGTYTVTVTDANGCTISGSSTITQPTALTTSAVRTNVSCLGANDGSVNLTVSGGVAPYTFSWSNGATTEDISGLSPGTFAVTVTDANGCTATRSSTVTQPSALTTSHTQIESSCFGLNTGSINLSVAGGTPAYTYLWSNGRITQDISSLAAGAYTVTVTDLNGCTTTHSATITEPAPITLTTVKTDVLCYGGNNGAIDLSVSGGTVPYFYSWSNGSNSQDLTSRTAGTYTVTVTDVLGCTATTSVTITQPANIAGTVVRTNVTCNGANNGTINLTLAGGVSPYSFAWSNGATTEDVAGLAPGSYSVTITDANGCQRVSSATVTQPTALTTSNTKVNVACFGASSGSINLSVAGGTAPYTYLWSHGPTTQDVNALAAGDYTVTVTDANTCVTTRTVNISQPTQLILSSTKVDVLCSGYATGSIDLTVSGGVTTYNYLWSNGATTQDLINRTAGTYTVTVTDANACTATLSATITQPAGIVPSTTQVNVLCFGGNNGSIDLTVVGGSSPYGYAWSTGAITQDINDLTAASYTVTITDASGCSMTRTTTITQPALLNPTGAVTNVSCFGGNNGSINLSVAGGVSPFTYIWSTGATTEDISTLLPGTYTVTVTDNNACTATRSIAVTEPAAALASTYAQTNVSCFGGSNGAIDLTVTGGTASYSYLWSTGTTTQDLSSRPIGTYTVTVTDARGCTTTNSATLTQPTAINPTTTKVDVLCNGGNNGSIDLTVVDGTAPYSYAWSSGAVTQDITGRTAGNYTVTVTDAMGCTVTRVTNIAQPAAFSLSSTQVNVSCNGGNNASINLTVSGSNPPYTYLWSTGAITEDINTLTSGAYTVTVSDVNACTATRTVTITQPAAALSTSETHFNVSCNGGSNGSIDLSVAGGTTPYSYLWSSGATTQDITGRTAGTYTVTVTDANACTTTISVTLTQPPTAVSTSETHVNVNCFGGNNGSIDLTVSGGAGAYTYGWSSGATTQDITGRTAGTYTVTVTDANGCTTSRATVITQPADITLTLAPTSPTWYGGDDGFVDLTPAGGTPPYTYLWSTGATTQDIIDVGAGNYSVTVTDSRGCIKTGSTIIANAVQAQPYCEQFNYDETFGYTDGTTTSTEWSITCSGCDLGNGGYFEVRNNQFRGNDLDGQGVWTSKVVDITGMTNVELSVNLTETGDLEADDYIRVYYKLNGGAETLFPSGDRTDDFGTTTVTRTGLSGSTIQIVVRMDNDAPDETHGFDNICIIGNMMYAVTSVVTNDTCIGGRVGAIDITVDNVTGIPPFTYTWSTGATTQDISGLSAGTYNVTVRDAVNTVVTRSVVVGEVNKFCKGALTCRTIYYIIQATGTSAAPDVYYIDNEDETYTLVPINTTQTAVYNGIGYNHKDGFMYGIEHSGANVGRIWKIDSTGSSISIGRPAGIAGGEFYGATVFEDGTLLGYSGTTDMLYRINISSTPPVIKNTRSLPGMDFIDIAVNPRDGKVYGYDRTAERFFWMDTTLVSVHYFGTTYTNTSYSFGSAFFDPLGNMYVYGSNSGGGSQTYVYKVNVGLNGSGNAAITQIGTGPAVTFSDGCSCPFGFFIHKLVSPTSAMAGDTVEYQYAVGNMSLFDAQLSLLDTMDDGRMYIAGSLDNPFGGTVNGYGATDYLSIINFNIPSKTIDTIKVKVRLPLAPLNSTIYNQAMVVGLPGGYEDTIFSDYPLTDDLVDATPLTMNNRPPVVVNDTVTTCRNTPIQINVLANDYDYDGSVVPTTVTLQTTPANGTAVVSGGSSSLYCEAFTYTNNTTTNANWTRVVTGTNLGDGGHFSVQSNQWSSNDLDGEAVWSSSVVNIATYTNISLSVNLSESGNMENTDYIRVYYRLNGGSEIALTGGIQNDDFNSAVATASGLNGSTIQIVIRVRNDNGSETHFFDNVCISGFSSGSTPGRITYTPNAGFAGVNTFTYRVCDNGSSSQCRTATVRVTVSTAVTITLVTLTDASCTGGAINITPGGGTSPYTYAWSNGATTQDLTALPSGSYTLSLTDATGCSATANYTISTSSALSTSIVPAHISCAGVNNGSLDLSVSGGRTPYTYTWSNGPTTQDISSLAAGTYSVTVRDANNCTITANGTITAPAALSASNTFTNVGCNGGSNGTIDLTVSGGTSPYTYSWTGGVTTEDRTGLAAATYTVTVTDSRGCTATSSRAITAPTALSTSATTTNVSCNGGNSGAINLTVSGGTSPYTFQWSNGATSEDVGTLAIGTYTVTVIDANSCTATLNRTLTQPTAISASSTQVNVTCNGGSNGSIDLTVSGGTSPYTYAWSSGQTTQDISGRAAGNYVVTITDANSCTVTYSADLFQPTPLATSIVATDILCNGASTGSIDLTVSGATSPYTYLWSNGATTQDLVSRPAGTYTVTVTDAVGCTATRSATINQPVALTASTSTTNILCNGVNTGAIDLTVGGGTTPYTFAWNGGATTEDRTALAAGSYTVTVTDANGCTITTNATITQPALLTASRTFTNVSCNGGSNGAIDVTVGGGTTPYTYLWSHGPSTQDLTGLSIGTYTITITDANGCSATLNATITQPNSLSAGTSKVDVSCHGGNNGSVNLTVSGGTTPYSFSWSNGATTEDLSSLTAGIYNVTVTDANGCTIATNAMLSQPTQLTANAVKSDLTCHGDNVGYIFLTVSGGVEPYSYAWNNGDNTQDITDLVAGTYTVTITDANSCTVAHSTTITEPAVVSGSHTQTNVSCFNGNNGSINLTINGGLPPFLFLWSNGATTEDISGLTAGTYSVTVVNTFGTCDFNYSATITQPSNYTASTTRTNVSCNGGSNGTIDLTVSGGVAPHTYLWSNGATTQDLSGLPAGTYTVTITDASSCTATASSTITQPVAPLTATRTFVDVGCNGGSDGSIDVSVSGGTSPYSYLWSTGVTTQDVTGLAVGTYTVTVTDNRGCTTTTSATISQPTVLSSSTTKIDVSCNGGDNGSIDLTVSGGTSPYTYVWSNGETVEDLSDLSIGTYNVTVTDAQGCTTTSSGTIAQPSALTASTTSVNVSCNGGSNGSVDLTVSGGTAPYTYLWSNGSTTQDLSGRSVGAYNVTVTDAQSCTVTAFANITQPSVISPTTTKIDVSCNGGSNGSVDLSLTGGTSPYTYLWSTGATTQDISSRNAGTYTVTITDANSCTATTSATVGQPAPMSASISKTDATCNGASNGELDLTVSGGIAPYTYEWATGETTEDITGLSIGGYEVTVSDAHSCVVVISDTIDQAAAIAITPTPTDAGCNGGADGGITISVSGGQAPYTYLWSNGNTTQNITGLTANTYTVTVTDAYSCTANASIAVGEASDLVIALDSKTDVSCNGGNNGSLNISVSGGTGASSFTWSNGATTEDVSGLAMGSYTVTVLDMNGCSEVMAFNITQPAVLSSTATPITHVSCNGGNNGAIELNVFGGTAPYTYNWTGGVTTEDRSGLAAGTYTVTISDANGCSATRSVTINQPAVLVAATGTQVNVSCNGGTDGSIDLTVSGGTPSFTYIWTTGATTQDINGLAVGTYTVTVTDARSCTATHTATITQPAVLAGSIAQVNVSCKNGSNASINLTVSGGTGPFTFTWSTGATTEDMSGLVVGTYTVTITDSKACTATQSTTITEPTQLAASTTRVNVSCNGGNNGSIDLTPAGGTSPYTYLWSTGATTQDISTLAIGTYTVTVTDALSCTVTTSATITQPSALTASATKVDATCNGATNGSINVTVSGGVAPYTYNWGGGITTEDRTGLAIGTYTVTVTDAQSCTATTSATVAEPAVLVANTTGVNVSCTSGSDGSVDLSVSGGTGPFTYLWSNGATTQDISGLTIGTYDVTVTDAQSCTATASRTITEPTILSATRICTQVSCNGGNNGSVDVSVSGGTAPYTYLWSNGATTQDISTLVTGVYTVTVTDALSCTVTTSATITQPAALSATTTKVDVFCNGGNNASIDLTVLGGTAPYTYLWSNGATTQDIGTLVIGTYTVTVTDAQSCTVTTSATIAEPTVLTASTTKTDVGCNGGGNGAIDLTVGGGTAPYTYLWSNGATTQDVGGLMIGTFNVTVTDARSCTVVASATIGQPAALAASAVKVDASCMGGSNGSIDVTAGGGTAPYTYNWTTGATTQDVSGLIIGTYTVTVSDAQGCTATASATIAEPTALSASVTKVDVSCNGGANGTIDLTAGGGTTNYSYLWSNGATTQDVSGLIIGTYTVTVTDAQSCTATATATIGQPNALVATATTLDASCNGGNDGSVDLTVTGGTTSYSFLWSTGAVSEDITGLAIGTYTVTVTDAQSCTATTSATVAQPAALAASTAKADVSCNGGSDGAMTLTVSGGTAAYTYLWSNGETTKDITGLTIGTYTVTVTDAQSCVITRSATIAEPSALSISAVKADPSCNGGNNGSINLTVNGGTAAYTYLWSNGAVTQDITGLEIGTYDVTVTDAQSCTATATEVITQPAILVALVSKEDATCNGISNGSIDLTVNGGTAAYTYFWSNGATTEDVTNVAAGTYTVTVTDAQSCSVSAFATVNQPTALSLSAVGHEPVCYGCSDGDLDLTVSGGTFPYSYLWNNGETTEDLMNIPTGNYCVTVTDAQNCIDNLCLAILQPDSILVSTTVIAPLCNGDNDGEIHLAVNGGNGPYTFLWSTGSTQQNLVINVTAGTYTVTVTDFGGVTKSVTVLVSQPTSVTASHTQQEAACYNGTEGSIDLTPAGGTPPYTYIWSTGDTTQDVTGLTAASYTVTITDAHYCTVEHSVNITEPAVLATSLTKTDITCNGGSNGSIDLSVTGGTVPYIYLWSNGETTEDINTPTVGNYIVTVTDVNGCSATDNITITQPSVITGSMSETDAACNGGTNGAATINVSGGVAPYTYIWSTGDTTQGISGLTSGIYNVTVTDSQACVFTASAVIGQPGALTASATHVDVSCNGGNDGSVDLTASSGTPPYSYLWSTGATAQDIAGLPAGTYTATVTDALGCVATASATIAEPAVLATSTITGDVACNGGSNGNIDLTVSGGTTPYDYLWSTGATTQDIAGVIASTYTVTVTDAQGCIETETVLISQPAIISATLTKVDVSCSAGTDGSIDLTVGGGSPPYTFLWNNGATTEDITGLNAGNYEVTISDAQTCVAVANITIGQPALLDAAPVKVDVQCSGNSDGSVDVTVTGGTAPYTFLWSTGDTTEDLLNITIGNYTLTVTDAQGCTDNAGIMIAEPTALALSASKIDINCFGANNGMIDLTVTGGVPPYTYLWSNGSTSQDIGWLAPGVYTVTVTDAQNCVAIDAASILQPALLTATLTKADVTCNSGNNGAVDLTAGGGTTPFTYLWSNGATTEDIGSVLQGTYTVTVTDAQNCTVAASSAVAEPAALAIAFNITHASCIGAANASVNTTISGGVPPYTYLWNTTETTEDLSGLGAATYTLTVTDAQNCTAAATATVSEAPAIVVTQVTNTPVSCNGDANGAINVSVSGGTPGYTYLWSTGATTEDISSLIAGSYTLTVTDAQACTAVQTYNVGQPPVLSGTITAQDANCNGSADGSINVTVSGGTAPYIFLWSNGTTTEDLNGLVAGTYTVTVTDAHNCVRTASQTVGQPPVLTIGANISNASCFGQPLGGVDITVSGGVAPYTYLWSNGSTTEDIVNVTAGSYTVTVTDAHFCSRIAVHNIGQPTAGLIISVTGISDAKCFGQASGFVNINVTGGTPPYTYTWSHGITTQNALALAAGSYAVTVTDSKGCTRVGNYNIGQPSDVVVTLLSANDAACFGAATGSVNINVSGGTPAYTYLWSTGATTQDITSIGAGNYTVTVTDAHVCVKTHTYTISQSPDIGINLVDSTNVSCKGATDGAIDIDVIGGTPGYTYLWGNGAVTQDISGIAAGHYEVTITDTRNCTKRGSFNISGPDAIVITIAAVTDAACKGQASGSIVVNVAGGTSPYTFRWSNGATTKDIASLDAGNYVLTVTDAHNCTAVQSANIGEPTAIAVNAASVIDNRCFGDSTGIVQIVTQGGTTPYTYVWSNGNTTQNISAVKAGAYTVTVVDAKGCIAEESYDVRQPDSLQALITEIVNATCNAGGDGEIKLEVHGGTPPYTYKWSNTLSTPNIANLVAGTYTVTVSDVNLCRDVASGTVQEGTSLTIRVDEITEPVCFGDTNGGIKITISGGNLPYVVRWSNGKSTEDITNIGAGSYTVNVTDAYGCAGFKEITVEQPDRITTANSTIIEASCAEMEDGRIELNVSGGTAPYTYLWNSGETGPVVDSLANGYHIVSVTDANGCFREASFTFEAPGCNRPPMAIDDTIGTTTGGSTDIPVMNNDSDPDGDNITVTDIIRTPGNGTVTINSDGTITYTPGPGFIGEDMFTYVICDDGNPSMCDTASVYITIRIDRPDLYIPNAISPNRDESNEFWEIRGIHLFPNNEVIIFNRWGNEVYRMNSYKNQWNGVNQDKEPLPDGTYYYILKLNDKDKSVYTGYVIIFRG